MTHRQDGNTFSFTERRVCPIVGANDAEIWSTTWQRSRSRPKPRWGFIFHRIAAHVPLADQTILELGAGEGNLAHYALKAGARHVTLVDFSEAAFQRARRLLEPWPDAKKSFVCANLLNVDLGRRFDLVWSSGVVEHFAGAELERCIERHAAHSRLHVAIVAPSDTAFNRRRSLDPRCRALFGFWQTIPDAVLADLVSRQGFDVRVCQRFRRSYGVPLLPIRGTRRVQAWLHRILFDFLLSPVLPARTGGLLLVVGERHSGT